jgi:hypothetical protein
MRGRGAIVAALVCLLLAPACKVLPLGSYDEPRGIVSVVNTTTYDYFVRVEVYNCSQLPGPVTFTIGHPSLQSHSDSVCVEGRTGSFIHLRRVTPYGVIFAGQTNEMYALGPPGHNVVFDVFGAWCAGPNECYDMARFT